jgi:multidrug efflux pump subunit AcrB
VVRFFRELILVIAGIVLISMATAVTVTPMLTAVFLGNSVGGGSKSRFEIVFDHITGAYRRLLEKALAVQFTASSCRPLFSAACLFA